MKAPDVYYGRVEEIPMSPDLSEDDDGELTETPRHVVQILGFDPAEDDPQTGDTL